MKEVKHFLIVGLIAIAMIVTALNFADTSHGAKRKFLYPYKMVVESDAGGFDSVIYLNDNLIADSMTKTLQGFYEHTFAMDEDSGALGYVFDSVAFYYDIRSYDAGYLAYGIAEDFDANWVAHPDSAVAQFVFAAELGTEAGGGGGWYKIRGLGIQERGIGTAELDTFSVSDHKDWVSKDSMAFISLYAALPGGINADSVMIADKLRLLIVEKDSTQLADTLLDDGWTFHFRTFMIVKEEY